MPDVELSAAQDLELIGEAAAEGGRIAMHYFKRKQEVWMKEGDSPVGEADYAVDKYLRETLTAARPHYGWLSEETVDSPARLTASRTFVVDPIDGTRAFIDGRSTWCVSVAVVENGRPLAGILVCPAKSEIFAASLGGGATRNGRRLAVDKPSAQPIIGGPKQLIAALPPHLGDVVRKADYVPSLAYRLAMVATGQLDGSYVKPHSHDWDLAAADLILAEAGGAVVDAGGRRLAYATTADPSHGVLVAGSGPLLDELVAALGRPSAQASA